MDKTNTERRFLLCIHNDGCPASLDIRKVYPALPDSVAEFRGLVRVIDETGEDYLYPASFFVSIELPEEAVEVLARIT